MAKRTSHAECWHASTNAARARCRKARAQYANDHKYEIEYNHLADLAEQRHAGRNGLMTTAQHALCAGAENADDSLDDLGTIRHSEDWYRLTISGFWSLMNDTRGGDLRWQMNVEDCTAEELDSAEYTILDD